jgi:transcriptional regulator with XRE-family HTH domain
MARFVPDPDVLRLGEALAALRRDRGLSQAEAGARVDMTSQGWGLYESGRRPGLFRPDVQRRLTAALDATPEDLALRIAREGADPGLQTVSSRVESRSRDWTGPAPELRRLVLSTDELSPWAQSGVVLEYRIGQWPRRGQGCVIETADGSTMVRIYEAADADHITLQPVAQTGEAISIPRGRIVALSAVTARLET